MLAYSVRNLKIGEPFARYNEKKYIPPKVIKPNQILFLFRVIFVFLLLYLLLATFLEITQ